MPSSHPKVGVVQCFCMPDKPWMNLPFPKVVSNGFGRQDGFPHWHGLAAGPSCLNWVYGLIVCSLHLVFLHIRSASYLPGVIDYPLPEMEKLFRVGWMGCGSSLAVPASLACFCTSLDLYTPSAPSPEAALILLHSTGPSQAVHLSPHPQYLPQLHPKVQFIKKL